MNYTEKYHLPQWEETDRIMRTDFNGAMSNLEAGLTEAKSTADEALVKPYVIGYYTGSSLPYFNVDVGFRPRAVIIAQAYNGTDEVSEGAGNTTLLTEQSGGSGSITDTGFYIIPRHTYPTLGRDRVGYVYIAFR